VIGKSILVPPVNEEISIKPVLLTCVLEVKTVHPVVIPVVDPVKNPLSSAALFTVILSKFISLGVILFKNTLFASLKKVLILGFLSFGLRILESTPGVLGETYP